METNARKIYSKSEFYWGLFSSLVIAVTISILQYEKLKSSDEQHLLSNSEKGSAFTFALLPFLGIYFLFGVIMLFIKKSERFGKGLLLSALILLFIMILVFVGSTRF